MLLGGFAALLGVCTALTGCQTASVRHDAVVARSGQAAPSRPFLSFFRRPSPAPEVTTVAKTPAPPPSRPAPITSSGQPASEWRGAQRVRADQEVANPPAAGVVQAGPAPVDPGAARIDADVPPVQPVTIARTSDVPPAEPVAPPKDLPDASRLVPQPAVIIAPPVVHAEGPPREFAKKSLPPYAVEPPDVLLIQAAETLTKGTQPVDGPHLVRPDGTVSLGRHGSVYVAGMTLEEIRTAVASQLMASLSIKDKTLEDVKVQVVVDVIAYNSKVYYVITDGGGYGAQIATIPATGNETVLDALAKVNGLPPVASKKKVWVARPLPHDAGQPITLPVDYCAIVAHGSTATNYQVFPGDRIYVGSDPWIVRDSWLAKRLAPVERLLGVTLLGSSTVNSIKNGGRTGSGTGTTP
jgi:polysaccharide export outer membrane protein